METLRKIYYSMGTVAFATVTGALLVLTIAILSDPIFIMESDLP